MVIVTKVAESLMNRENAAMIGKKVSLYQFEPVIQSYFDCRGEKKEHKSTTCKDYYDVPLKKVYQLLMNCVQDYLRHRYYVTSDKVYWGKFLAETNKHIIWLDYSMNMKWTPKCEVQSAHFFGRQHTLHNALI